MLKIDFMPEDYRRHYETTKTDFMYIGLLGVVLLGLGCLFIAINIRQKALAADEQVMSEKMGFAQDSMQQSDEFYSKREGLMDVASHNAGFLESVPKSVLLALLTNKLPGGVSFVELEIVQKMPKQMSKVQSKVEATSKFEAAKAKEAGVEEKVKESGESLLETHISIKGVAPSDLQVAIYIKRLSNSKILSKVELVESKECKASSLFGSVGGMEDKTMRQFKLTAIIKNDISLTSDDIFEMRQYNGKR